MSLPYKDAVEQMNLHCTSQYLKALMQQFGGNVVKASEHAQVERGSLYRLLRKCGIKVDEFQS